MKKNQNFIDIALTIKLEIIYTKVWPAIILALNRIAKLKQRITYENISIIIRNGSNKKGHSGTKILKNFIL